MEKEFKVKMEKLNADHKNSIKKIDKRLQQYVKKLEEKNEKSKRIRSNLKKIIEEDSDNSFIRDANSTYYDKNNNEVNSMSHSDDEENHNGMKRRKEND